MTSSTDPVLELGRELAARLADWDVLGRWMAHHLAELIEQAQDSNDPADQAAASDIILQIWRQRHTLGDKYPLHNYDAVLSTLDSLGDRTAANRLMRQFGPHGPSDAEQDVSVPLQLAVKLEEALHDVQTWLLAEAADAAQNHDAPWVELAQQQRDNDEGRALRRIQRAMRDFRLRAQDTTTDGTTTQPSEPGSDSNDAAEEDDPTLHALNRAIELLTVLRDARQTQKVPPPTKDNVLSTRSEDASQSGDS